MATSFRPERLLVPVITPFDDDGRVDGEVLERHADEILAAGVRVAGVEAEADAVGVLGVADRVPHATDAFQAARHRVVAAGCVFDQQRHAQLEALDALAPVVEPELRVVGLQHMTAVHDDSLSIDLGC